MENKKALNDTNVIIAGLIGIVSTIVGEICSRIFIYFGIGKYSAYQLNSLIVTYNRPSAILGFMLNLLIGGIIGAAVYLTAQKWGDKHVILLSLAYTLVAWMFLEIIFNVVVNKSTVTTREFSGYYNQYISAVIHAVAKGLMLNFFIFKKSK
ncbi:membrane protein [Clostridium acetobutylicum]|nr:membrane protein [Clostridium acetobutylicum]